MAANFCLPPAAVNKFKESVLNGKIDPYKLKNMSSDERRAIFEDVVGKEGAKQVNAEFEAKTLLKNQKYAYTAWAKKVAGITPATRRDLVAQISKLDKVLSPADEKSFLKDLASTKLGVNVTDKEAKNIADLSSKVTDAENGPRSTPEQSLQKGFTLNKADLEYGRARDDLEKYVGDLKGRPGQFKVGNLKTPGGVAKSIAKLPRAVGDVTKSLGASLDDSFALRQGSKAFWTDFPRWQKSFRDSLVNIAKALKNPEAVEHELNAHLIGDPMYDQALKDGLAIRGVKSVDDVFPTSAPEKIPVLGRAFTASEVGYSGMADSLRLAIYKNEMKLAQKSGDTLPASQRKNIATMVNSLTGRGSFGRGEAIAGHLNALAYSARFVKSNLDTLIGHPLGSGVGGSVDYARGVAGAQPISAAQRKAATNLVKIIAGTAATLGIADKLKPGSVEWDPRSTRFGKIKAGNTTFDITGGMGSIATLAARLGPLVGHQFDKNIKAYSKSASGNLAQINSGAYGAETGIDVLVDFITGKASPVAGIGVDVLKGTNFSGKPTSLKNEGENVAVPLNIQDFNALRSGKGSPNLLASMLADTLGLSTSTIAPSQSGKQSYTAPVTKTLTKAGYTPSTLAKTQDGVKLNPTQYSKLNNLTQANFTQAVNAARNDPTFKSYNAAQQKKSLSLTLAQAKAKALSSMGINKKPNAPSMSVKTY